MISNNNSAANNSASPRSAANNSTSPRLAAIYTRVSTDDQTTDNQTLALEQYARVHNLRVVRRYNETHSAYGDNSQRRPLLQRMLDEAKHGHFDVVIVWRIDRLSRSLQHLLGLMSYFGKHGIHPIFVQENINTTTPEGKLLLAMSGAFAEFSSSLTSARTKAAYDRCKSQNKPWGNKEKPDEKQIQKILKLRSQGLGYFKIGKKLNIPTTTVRNALKRRGL